MSQQVDTATKTLPVSGALGQFLRVKTPTSLALAGATDVSIGTMEESAFAGDRVGTVRLVTAQGTCKMVASEAITAGNPVYAAADGKIAATGTVVEGRALEAAVDDGDVIEVLRIANTDISATITGTNAAAFTVDADATTAKVAIATGAGTGDFTASIVAPTLAANRTITLPAVDATLATLAGTETLANKTLTAPVFGGTARFGHTVTPVAAAGSAVADAAALGDTTITHITSDGAAKGVKLPAVTTSGVVRLVINDSATAAELYAEPTGTVNGLAADASVVIPASKGLMCISTAAKTWIVFDLTALATAS